MRAITAAGGVALLFLPDQIPDDQDHDYNQDDADQYRREICSDPLQHGGSLLSERMCAGGGGPAICSIRRACAILQIISFRLRAAGSGIPVAIVCIDVFIAMFYVITVDQALLTALLVSFVASL